jgi:hypothetical protein
VYIHIASVYTQGGVRMTPTSRAILAVEAEAVGVQLEAQDRAAVALVDPDGARVRVETEGEEVDLGRGRVAASERGVPNTLANLV